MILEPFIRNALLAGAGVALACGLASYFLVLRQEVFASDALGHVAFTGALSALVFGLDPRIGVFGGCVAIGVLLARVAQRGHDSDTTIGSVFAWVLGLGVLLLSLFTASKSSSTNGAAGARVLFGSIFGLSDSQAIVAFALGVVATITLTTLARPLLFASTDEAVAEARGVPARLLRYLFLAIVGVVAGESAQAVGALLLLGLMSAPGGIAHSITANPYAGMALSVGVSLTAIGTGIALSYIVPTLPPSFSILAIAGSIYAVTLTLQRMRRPGVS